MFLLLLSVLLIIIGAFCVWIEVRKWYLNRTKLKAYSKLKEWPVLGVGGRFIGVDNEVAMQVVDGLFFEAKTPFAAWFGPSLVVGVDDPEDLQTILNADACLDKPYLYEHLRNETGLFSSKKDEWKKHRRVLNPTFNRKVMHSFMPVFHTKAQTLVQQLERHIGTSFDIYRPVFKALTDIIMNTGLGMPNWTLQNKRGDYMHDIFLEIFDSFQSRAIRFWYKWDFTYNFSKACKRELELLERGYRILRSVREVKEIELCEKMEQGDDELEKAKHDGKLTWIQKCFLMYRDGYFTEKNLIEEIDTIL